MTETIAVQLLACGIHHDRIFDAVPTFHGQRLPNEFLPAAVEGREFARAARIDDMLRRQSPAARQQQMIGRDMLRLVLDDVPCGQRRRDRFGERLAGRSEEHTSELQSLMRISYAVFCLNKKTKPP